MTVTYFTLSQIAQVMELVKQVKIDKETLRNYILWFIGQNKDSTVKRILSQQPLRFSKKEDRKATLEEIENFIKKIYRPSPSKRTIYRRLEELRNAELVEFAGAIRRRVKFYRKKEGRDVSEGKTGVYRVTQKGKLKFLFTANYLRVLEIADLHPDNPAIFADTWSPKGKLIFVDSFIRLTKPAEIEIVQKARNSKYFQTHEKEFRAHIAGAQKIGLLLYCKSLTDPRFKMLFREPDARKHFEGLVGLFASDLEELFSQ